MLRVLMVASLILGAFGASMIYNGGFRFSHEAITFDETWNAFKETYEKSYESAEEEGYRKQVFADNLQLVESHNSLHAKGLSSFTMGINKYSDLKSGEFKKGFRLPKDGPKGVPYQPLNTIVDFPKEVDWRKKGYVTPVKDQGFCGSCWAFSAIGCLEGQNYRKTKKLISLSEQNLVDCANSQGNEGCTGGFSDWAFLYIKDNDGVDTEASYPYTAKDDKCSYNATNKGATVVEIVLLPMGNETTLMEAVATIGPISVGIETGLSFNQYSGGILDDPNCGFHIDHEVLAVGYGSENGHDYWIVKNSWGTSFGEKGYIKMSRNKQNQCGIATLATYPLV